MWLRGVQGRRGVHKVTLLTTTARPGHEILHKPSSILPADGLYGSLDITPSCVNPRHYTAEGDDSNIDVKEGKRYQCSEEETLNVCAK